MCSNDGVCASSDKCCYDACLETDICKTAVKRYRRSLPDQSENDDLGAAKVSSVILTEGGNPVSVVVDGSGKPVTLVEGDAVTIVATGPVNFINSQNITYISEADKTASSDSVSSKKTKRAVIAESDRVSSNVILSPVDSVSIVKDRYGNVIVNDDKPLILVQKERGPTIILNDNGLSVLAGHDMSKGAVLGVVTPTTVPYLELQSHHPPSSAPDRDPIRVLVKGDGNPVTLVDGGGPLHVQNADGVSFVADVPEVTATDMPTVRDLPMTVKSKKNKINHIIVDSAGNPTKVKDGSGVLVVSKTAETSDEASPEENSSYSRRRKSRSSSNAVVDGNDITVTLVDASHVDVDIVDISGNKIDVVAGDHILNIGESTMATVEFVEGRPVVRDENGRILLDKMGSPLTVKPASNTQPLPAVYSIVDGKYKPVNLVASDGTPVHVCDSNGNELALNGGGSDLEVSRETVSIMKRSSGEDLLLQNGEALADEDGMLLKATSVNTRHYSEVSTNVLVDGDSNAVNLLSINGSPITVIDDSDNVVTVKTGNKNITIADFNVTVLLENAMMVLKKASGELVVDENGLPVTLVPEHRSRRRRSLASEGHGITDSHDNTVTLTDVHGVPVTLNDGKGNIVKPVAGEIIMETGTATAFIVETNEGKRLTDENGNFIVDSEGYALAFVPTNEIVSSQVINVIVDGTNNTVQLLSVRGSPITIVDGQGNDVAVKDGDVQIVKNTETAMIMDMVEDTEMLVDSSGSILTDLNGKNLRIMAERKKAQKVVANILVNGEGNTVTLSTLEGTPVTLLDNEEVVVTMAGEIQLAVDGTDTARVRRSSSEVNVVDERDYLLADDKGKLLTMKKVGEHKQTSVAANMLVDGEGNSVNLIDLNDSPITVVDDSGNNIALATGEKTLKVEMAGHLQVMETADEDSRSLENDGAKTKQKLLVDDAGNPVHSEKGPIQVVPTNNIDFVATEAENFLEVTEEFVEASFSLQRLSAVVKHEQHLLQLNLVRESSTMKSRDYESFVEEINVFVDVVGKLQAKCLKKIMQLLGKEPGSHEGEAYALLEEVNEILPNNIP